MQEQVTGTSHRILFFNTLAFTVCFAAWVFNGVMVTFLVDNGVFKWGPAEIGWLLGIPVLTGSIFRLPVGLLTDRFGGKWVFGALLMLCAVPMYLLSSANNFATYALLSGGFGLAGTGFAVGIAYTSVWYPRKWQGTALGIFGAGNAGAAVTTFLAPTLLNYLTSHGANVDNWRKLPQIYAAVLVGMGLLFLIFTKNKLPTSRPETIAHLLSPLKSMRVWRFGLYYFLVFGCFVAFSQWLVPYFVSVYAMSLVTAGLLTSLFSLPSGLIRALGGWVSDMWGARKVMYLVLGTSLVLALLLSVPRMEITSPGKGVVATTNGTVTSVSDSNIKVEQTDFKVKARSTDFENVDQGALILPTKDSYQTPVVQPGEQVKKKQLLAKETTRIYFQANVWIYTVLVILIGIAWGIGKAAVYKFIPEYFPTEVGVVGGTVGVIGGLGGFFCPIVFGYLLQWTGIWSSCWMLMFALSAICLWCLHSVVTRIVRRGAPHLAEEFEHKHPQIRERFGSREPQPAIATLFSIPNR
ncbi:MAG TPA: MFS transporter [Pyrinomonadaceae bacterium]|nr:MFS transporter [Pyrinomonadaceae bacterium]